MPQVNNEITLKIDLIFDLFVRYDDGEGGCDGCLNWSGVGFKPFELYKNEKYADLQHKYPITQSTSNNKLQMAARSLEFIYTLTDWPPQSKKLSVSLKDSGKSRADLWQFAGKLVRFK